MKIGSKHKKETKNKIARAFIGRPHSEETKRKISENRRMLTKERIIQIRQEMTFTNDILFDLTEISKILNDKIPIEILEDKTKKYLIQYLDDEGVIVHTLYDLVMECLIKVIPNTYQIYPSINRQNYVIKNMIYLVEPSRYRMGRGLMSLNHEHVYEGFTDTKMHTHKSRENPETFDYWNTQFDVIISLKPTRIKDILKKDGILIKI